MWGVKRYEDGKLVHPTYRVEIRRGGRWVVKPDAEQLNGQVYRFREGWVLTSEDTGIYSGEVAMIAIWDDPKYPYPLAAPVWIASGDLRLLEVEELRRDLVEQAQ